MTADLLRFNLGVPTESFQERVQPWLMECFGPMISGDTKERNHRFLEESLELVQACGCTQSEAHQLVDYVFGRPVGDPPQEVGGVMVTLAALCLAHKMDMHQCGDVELARIWTKVEAIRAKQAAKPKHSPLPMLVPTEAVEICLEDLRPGAFLVMRKNLAQRVTVWNLKCDGNHGGPNCGDPECWIDGEPLGKCRQNPYYLGPSQCIRGTVGCTERHEIADTPKAIDQDTPEGCKCPTCQEGMLHCADCGVHNEPSYPNGACTCGTAPSVTFLPADDTEGGGL